MYLSKGGPLLLTCFSPMILFYLQKLRIRKSMSSIKFWTLSAPSQDKEWIKLKPKVLFSRNVDTSAKNRLSFKLGVDYVDDLGSIWRFLC